MLRAPGGEDGLSPLGEKCSGSGQGRNKNIFRLQSETVLFPGFWVIDEIKHKFGGPRNEQCYAVAHMPTKRKSPEKTGALNFAQHLDEAVEKPEETYNDEPERTPIIGDRVTVGKGESIWTVSKVSVDGKEVGLQIPGTNLERFRVPTSDLTFLDSPEPRKPSAPPKPKYDITEVRERIESIHQSAVEHLNGEITVLKKYLKSNDVSEDAIQELDDFVMDVQGRWGVQPKHSTPCWKNWPCRPPEWWRGHHANHTCIAL